MNREHCWLSDSCEEPLTLLAGADGFNDRWPICSEHGEVWRRDSGLHYTTEAPSTFGKERQS